MIRDHLRVVHMFAKIPPDGIAVDTTSRSQPWAAGLSPFHLPGGKLYGDYQARTMENAWQYAKVYARHILPNGEIAPEYFAWAQAGWDNPRAVRYPMGKGARPEFSLWDGERLGYIEARKKIYVPLYSRATVTTLSFAYLTKLLADAMRDGKIVYLRDWDGYDHVKLGMTLQDVGRCETKKMGHAFVLVSLLCDDPIYR